MMGRDRIILVVVGLAALLIAPYLLVVAPKRSQAAKLQSQITKVQGQLAAARSQAVSSQAAQTTYAKSYTTLVKLGEAVPTDDNTPSLIYQLQSAASAAHVDFQSLALTPNAATSSSTTTSSTTTGSTSTSQAATAALPPGASVGPAGFPVEPFSFTFEGNFFNLADFLGRLQRFVTLGNQQVSVSGRLMTLNAISLAPAPSGFPKITATISATTFLLPASQGLLNGATPAGPPSPTSQQVSTPTAGSPSPPAAVTAPVR
jgi:Tfp pilus assembly protein PilO